MKIALWHNLPSGGAKRALHGHVAGLVARGHRVEVWCPDSADDAYLPLSALTREHRLPLHYHPIPGRGPFVGWWNERQRHEAMERHSQRCVEEIMAGGFDVFLGAACRFYCVPYIIHHLRTHEGMNAVRTVLYLQEPNRALYEALPELPWAAPVRAPGVSALQWSMKRAANSLLISRLRREARREADDIRRFDLVLCNSFFSRESILRAYNQDARVCYLGIDVEHFRPEEFPPSSPPAAPELPYLIGVGSLQWTKGVDTAIQAVARLSDPKPHLVWVANHVDASYAQSMRVLAEAEGVSFEIRSQVTDAELITLLRRARLMLYTSRLEPFGYAPLEANACGTPVVAVAEGGVRETVRDGINGFLCERDPRMLAAAIGRVLADTKLAVALSCQARDEVTQKWSTTQSDERLEGELIRQTTREAP